MVPGLSIHQVLGPRPVTSSVLPLVEQTRAQTGVGRGRGRVGGEDVNGVEGVHTRGPGPAKSRVGGEGRRVGGVPTPTPGGSGGSHTPPSRPGRGSGRGRRDRQGPEVGRPSRHSPRRPGHPTGPDSVYLDPRLHDHSRVPDRGLTVYPRGWSTGVSQDSPIPPPLPVPVGSLL